MIRLLNFILLWFVGLHYGPVMGACAWAGVVAIEKAVAEVLAL